MTVGHGRLGVWPQASNREMSLRTGRGFEHPEALGGWEEEEEVVKDGEARRLQTTTEVLNVAYFAIANVPFECSTLQPIAKQKLPSYNVTFAGEAHSRGGGFCLCPPPLQVHGPSRRIGSAPLCQK